MREVHYRRILIPLDGSDRALEAMPVAAELARRFSAKLYLLVAFNLVGRLFVPSGSRPIPAHYQKLRAFEHEQIGTYLSERQGRLRGEGVESEAVVVEDDPADAIVNASEEHQIDLIVMTSHGQRGWTRWISGSVTESVLRRAPCPVMVLRQGAPQNTRTAPTG